MRYLFALAVIAFLGAIWHLRPQKVHEIRDDDLWC